MANKEIDRDTLAELYISKQEYQSLEIDDILYEAFTEGWDAHIKTLKEQQKTIMKTEKLNTYKVTSRHDVYIDNFVNGEESYVNSYKLSSEVDAINWKDAIKKYFEDYLFYTIDLARGYIDDDNNTFHYSNLVNVDNIEASESELKQWKENKLTLYSNNTTITVNQLINVNLKYTIKELDISLAYTEPEEDNI